MTLSQKKIILIGPMPPYRGGIARFSATLAEELVNAGHDVKVISYRKQYPRILYPGKTEKDFSQRVSLVSTEFLFSPLNFQDWRATINHIVSYQPDLVIYQWWTNFWAPATAWLIDKLNKARINTKIVVHNAFPHESTWLDRKIAAWALGGGRSFVTMADLQADILRSAMKSQVEIVTTPHPVYKQFPVSGLSKVEARKKIGLPLEVSVALFFGFVRPYKGLSVLLDAIAVLKSWGSNLHLVVAGEFWDDQAVFEKQIEALGIEDLVTIRASYIPDSEAGLYFEAADLFVAPYIGGTQSGSIKQAMAYGLPLVVTDVICDPTIRENESGVIVVPAGDGQMLAQGIQHLINNANCSDKPTDTGKSSWSQLISVLLSTSSDGQDIR